MGALNRYGSDSAVSQRSPETNTPETNTPQRKRRPLQPLQPENFSTNTPQRKRRPLQPLQPENFSPLQPENCSSASELPGRKVPRSPVACRQPLPVTELTCSESYASVKQPAPKKRRRLVVF